MTDNVLTMNGKKLQTVGSLADWLKSRWEDGSIKSVVMVMERNDAFMELAYSRQTHSNIVFAAAVLQQEALLLAAQSVIEDD